MCGRKMVDLLLVRPTLMRLVAEAGREGFCRCILPCFSLEACSKQLTCVLLAEAGEEGWLDLLKFRSNDACALV